MYGAYTACWLILLLLHCTTTADATYNMYKLNLCRV